MRIGEVLKLKPKNVQDRKLLLPNPKSGRASEIVFIPQKVADRLREYIAGENIQNGDRIFPLGYTRAREIVKNAGLKIGIDVKPHDLRRHAATYASRSGVPIEIKKSFSGIQTCPLPSVTLVKSVILRPCIGLKNIIRYLFTLPAIESNERSVRLKQLAREWNEKIPSFTTIKYANQDQMPAQPIGLQAILKF